MLIDHFGNHLPQKYLEYLVSVGIDVRIFNGNVLDFLKYIARRNHSKIIISDSLIVMLGGRNSGDQYVDQKPSGNMIDADTLIQGQAFAGKVSGYFQFLWDMSDSRTVSGKRHSRIESEMNLIRQLTFSEGELNNIMNQNRQEVTPNNIDFVEDKSQLDGHTARLVREIQSAKKTIFMVTPYPVFPKLIYDALVDAVSRGVNVFLVTNSHESNDLKIVQTGYVATTKEKLLQNGIRVWELEGAKYALHAKLTVFDKFISYVGSFNWDNRSVQNFESGVIVRDRKFAKTVMEHARNITKGSLRQDPLAKSQCSQLLLGAGFLLSPFL
jgi:phosphatidylserine/phosphatidylglycerophosphate/cardiolipin synthase-like enzyme